MNIKDIQPNEREFKMFDSLYEIIKIMSWQQEVLSRQQKFIVKQHELLDECKDFIKGQQELLGEFQEFINEQIEEQKETIHKPSSKISMSPMTQEEKEKYQKEYEEEVEKAKRNYYGENYKKDSEE